MLQLGEELLFIHDRVNTSLRYDSPLVHFLHCKQLLFLFLLYFPDLSESSSANDIVKEKVVFSYLYKDKVKLEELSTSDIVLLIFCLKIAVSH